MPAARHPAVLRPALLDRLCPPDGPPIARSGHEGLLRDLRDLFNTTRTAGPDRTDSVLGYGLPAIAGRPASAMTADDLAALLLQALLRFEPRLAPDSLRVVPETDRGQGAERPPGAGAGPRRRFRVSGCLRTPGGAAMDLLTEIDLDTGQARLMESR